MDLQSPYVDKAVSLVVLVISLTFHEFAHAWTAMKLGDDTAKDAGRLTLNPLAHLDPIGTLFILFAPFGWARPVPFNPANFRAPVRDSGRVGFAGPLTNLVISALALLAFASLFGSVPFSKDVSFAQFIPPGTLPMQLLAIFLRTLAIVNLALAAFNLLPMSVLDGNHILRAAMPQSVGQAIHSCTASGLASVVLLFLILTDIIDYFFLPVGIFLFLLFLGGLIPIAIWSAVVFVNVILFFLTLPATPGGERRSFFGLLRMVLAVCLALLCLGGYGLSVYGIYRCTTAESRLACYEKERPRGEARVLRQYPQEERFWPCYELSVPFGDGLTTAEILVAEAPAATTTGSTFPVLIETDEETGKLKSVLVPETYTIVGPNFYIFQGVLLAIATGALVFGLLIWPWKGIAVPEGPPLPTPEVVEEEDLEPPPPE